MTEKHSPVCPFEHIENPDQEAKKIAETADLTVQLLDKRYPNPSQILRGVHPKSHGCVKALFEINSDISQQLQVGLFGTPGKIFDTLIRFSNAAARLGPDISEAGEHGSRGMAIKVLDVGGEVLIDDNGASNQDFLMINQPVFAFANTEDYLRLTRVLVKNNDNPSAFFSPLKLQDPSLTEEQKRQIQAYIEAENISQEDTQRILDTFKIVKQIQESAVSNPLDIQYFSAAPFLFGSDKVMKFSVKPVSQVSHSDFPANPSDDYLREALSETMHKNEAIVFDFMVQVRNDDAMEIENASSLWDENRFPFIKVAKITIPATQVEIDSEQHKAHCEALAFTPWHSLVEHQPIGSINRLRKPVYQASEKHRNEADPVNELPYFMRILERFFKFLFG